MKDVKRSTHQTSTAISRVVVVGSVALLVAFSSPGSVVAQSIGSLWGTIGRCSTGTVRSWPINDQIARAHRCLAGVEIVPIEARPNIRLTRGTEWAHAQTRDALYRAAASQSLQINTAYRTMLEQTALRETCTTPAAATGRSNHETGTALDIQEAGGAQTSMEGAGCSWPAIPSDLVHYDCPPFGTPITSVLAFQQLWNLNNPSAMIAPDNSFGPITRNKLMASPIAGFADDGCAPPPPPSCDDTAGGFTFSCDGVEPDQRCVALNETDDPDGWSDNYFCSAADIGMVWSPVGAIAGMNCTQITAPADSEADAWTNNYLCLPADAPYDVLWSDSGPIAGMDCVRWYEPAESEVQGRADDYLCLAPTSPDADAGVDAGIARDAGDRSAAVVTSGCGCRVAGPGSPAPWAGLALSLMVVGLVCSRSRRRRRR